MKTQLPRGLLFAGLCLWAGCGASTRAVEVRPRPATAIQASKPPQPPRTRLAASDFPERTGEFERAEMLDYSQGGSAALGFSINYRHPRGLLVSIYVYNADKLNIPDSDQSQGVREQLENASAEISRWEALGLYQSVERLGDLEVSIGDGRQGLKALGRSFRSIRNRREIQSYLYVTGYRQDFIKVRATYYYNPDTDTACNAAIQTFLADLGPMLAR